MNQTIESTSAEKIAVDVTTPLDPTGTPPDFAITTTSTEPTTWVAGTWDTTYNATTGVATALTPLVGDGQTIAVQGGTTYDLWVRWSAGGETPIKQAGILTVT